MTLDIEFFSYATALVAYSVLAAMAAVLWRGRPLRPALVVACLSTAAWAGLIASATLIAQLPVGVVQISELARDASWIFFMLQLASMRFDGKAFSLAGRRWLPIYICGLAALFCLLLLAPEVSLSQPQDLGAKSHHYIELIAWLGVTVMALLILEQLFRNSSETERWSIKYLCMGLGGLFAYDFFMYAEGVLFRKVDPNLWQARGLVNALAVPLIAISVVRDSNWRIELSPSRQVIFHSVTLMGTGIYLVVMALAGYAIQFIGGGWSELLQIAFLVASGVLLLVLLFSGTIRAKTRVFLSKHFFSYKYDYREEWLKFTQSLAGIGDNVPEGIIRCMAPLVHSPGGLLWASSDGRHYRFMAQWQMAEPSQNADAAQLAAWLKQREWVIDVDELRREPDVYVGLNPPPWLFSVAGAWLVVPLMFQQQLAGILVLKRSELQQSINWEDRDLLKTAGRQAASHLAQYLSGEALVEARQFEAFNRLSAYVIHDLKNILAQQSLIVSNAVKHRNNPAFVDDVINTVQNSVERMTRLMEQMRSGIRGIEHKAVHLGELLAESVRDRQAAVPSPALELPSETLLALADREQLGTVFSHLIQNAQEATDRSGRVTVRLLAEDDRAVIEIEDTGVGMKEDFVRNRLFKPFDSTKGLTGMGIGAFESREIVRKLGGDIRVSSTPGVGSLFRIVLPCATEKSKLFAMNEEAIGE